jgi:hypothetical protein
MVTQHLKGIRKERGARREARGMGARIVSLHDGEEISGFCRTSGNPEGWEAQQGRKASRKAKQKIFQDLRSRYG